MIEHARAAGDVFGSIYLGQLADWRAEVASK
jgi:hypothetical protein